jgi:phytanoyl-CoA hydroxylase
MAADDGLDRLPDLGVASRPSVEEIMLTKAQIEEYNEVGAIVVPDVLTAAEVRTLSDVTDGFVERARGLTAHTDVYDLENSHTADSPRVRRIKAAHLRDPAYAALMRHPRIIAVLQDLWGPDIRFDTAKLTMKCAGFGAPVEWHQDWAFYPHTNDNLAAVGVGFDDMAMENGPLMIIPGSHKGPTFDHHADGVFCGAIDPSRNDVDFSKAIALTGKAGSITVHHVRAVHGSAPNVSDRDRRLMLFQFRAADAWPILGFPGGIEAYDALMVAGQTQQPRLSAAPVRLPLPPANLQGSLYENQKGMKSRFFQTVAAQ